MSLKSWWKRITYIPEEPSQLVSLANVQAEFAGTPAIIVEEDDTTTHNTRVIVSKISDWLKNKTVEKCISTFSLHRIIRFDDGTLIKMGVGNPFAQDLTIFYVHFFYIGAYGVPSGHQFDLFNTPQRGNNFTEDVCVYYSEDELIDEYNAAPVVHLFDEVWNLFHASRDNGVQLRLKFKS